MLHKVLNSYFFLGSQRMPNFALFRGLEDAEISQKQDAVRDSYLESLGLTVVRYSNAEINREFRAVCEDIWNRIKKPSP